MDTIIVDLERKQAVLASLHSLLGEMLDNPENITPCEWERLGPIGPIPTTESQYHPVRVGVVSGVNGGGGVSTPNNYGNFHHNGIRLVSLVYLSIFWNACLVGVLALPGVYPLVS